MLAERSEGRSTIDDPLRLNFGFMPFVAGLAVLTKAALRHEGWLPFGRATALSEAMAHVR